MLTIEVGTSAQLRPDVEMDLAVYRHRVFVETLGWALPTTHAGMERDEFDRADTVYVVAKDDDQQICGCARLVSTTNDYLLDSVFPELMGNHPLPRSPRVWELSRYTTHIVGGDSASRNGARERFRRLLKSVVDAARAQGAERLITFSYVGVERLARSFGIHTHRVGPPQHRDGKSVLAFWIELDDQTFDALQIRGDSTFTASNVERQRIFAIEQARVAN
jgi:acyl homoserine lactone synthase